MNRRLFVRLFLMAATLAVYWQVTGHDFVDFDDPEYVRSPRSVRDPGLVKENAHVVNGLTPQGVQWAFTTNYIANWHPLTWLSLMMDAQVYPGQGRNPAWYHLTNLALHMVNVLVLFELLRSMTGALWRSAMVASLLALHPMHVESVAWVSERKDVLSMALWLGAISAYVAYVRRHDIRWYVLTAVLMALGLMAKAMLVTLPLVLLLLDYWPLKRFGWRASEVEPADIQLGVRHSMKRIVLEKIPLLALAGASSYITITVQHGSGQLEDGVWMPLHVRLANAAVSYGRYIGKMFWPENLAALYPNPSHIGKEFWSAGQVACAVAILVIVSAVAAVLSRKRPYLMVGWLWFLGTMAPVIGLVQIGRHSMADRYAYLPLIGLYVMIAWGISDLTSRWRLRVIPLGVAAALVLTACAIIAHRQASYWNNSTALFEHALAVTRDNWLIHNNLASVLEREDRAEEAVWHMREALRIYPDCAWMHNHLGGILARQNRLPEAQSEFEEALKLYPEYAEAHKNLAAVLELRGNSGQEIERGR